MNDTVEKQPADEAYRKVSIPLWGKKYPVYLHSLVALGILIGGWILLHFLGAKFMGQEEEGSHLGHLLDMAIFASVALVLAVATLYILFFTSIQKIVLPFSDELRDLTQRWRDGATITEAEANLARAWAINSGCRVIAVLLLIGLLATPL